MYRIRFHGRGGQGMKTASRILGRALFLEGFEVQDAPRYGAERRGAPIFAYVRADHQAINERGIITRPDLIVVADDSLMGMPAAGVLNGCGPDSIFLFISSEAAEIWKERLNVAGRIVCLPPMAEDEKLFLGAACVGGAARLLGGIGAESLALGVEEELSYLGLETVAANQRIAGRAYEMLSDRAGVVVEGRPVSAADYQEPNWLELTLEDVSLAAPAIHAGATSELLKTGLWRTERPVINEARCNRCWWICSTFCPEGVIRVDEERRPQIDYEHCKGCLVCLVQCPTHAIEARPEGSDKASGKASGGGQ